jgi:hypothetical protein
MDLENLDRSEAQERTIEKFSRIRDSWHQDAPLYLHSAIGNIIIDDDILL